jgi:hypothetical protein
MKNIIIGSNYVGSLLDSNVLLVAGLYFVINLCSSSLRFRREINLYRPCWGSGPAHVRVSGLLCGLEGFLVNTASTRGSEESNH